LIGSHRIHPGDDGDCLWAPEGKGFEILLHDRRLVREWRFIGMALDAMRKAMGARTSLGA
jgi:hypothetical protein